MTRKTAKVADLFCGAGGTSTGVELAGNELGIQIKLIAINHWTIAIETHSANHPGAEHLCANLDTVDPRKVVPGGRLRLLVASPECTHHSRARGGKPRSDQSRVSAWHVVRWAEALYIQDIIVENVPEFIEWGPLTANGKPMKRQKGATFRAFVTALKSLGYRVEWRILNCADYGDPTTRKRLFILARRGSRRITWPDPTHTKDGEDTLFGQMPKWRPAREIIDWSIKGKSIFNDRKKPLSENTMRRIFVGLQKFSGRRFVLPNLGIYRNNQPQDPEKPLGTVTSRGAGHIVEPYLVKLRGTSTAAPIDEPVPGLTAGGEHLALAEPFLLNIRGGQDGYTRGAPVSEPVQAVTGHPALALAEPYLVHMGHSGDNGRVFSPREPAPAVTTKAELGLVQPFIVPQMSGGVPRSTDDPLPTITTTSRGVGFAQPYLVQYHGASYEGGERVRSIDDPLATVAASPTQALVQPYLVKYHGTGCAQSIDEPLGTVSTHDRYGLVIPGVTPDGYVLDIYFRMLTPGELASAMSFPKDYQFAGNREERVRQIGNAVPVMTAKALAKALLES